jgi:hypothetical protein
MLVYFVAFVWIPVPLVYNPGSEMGNRPTMSISPINARATACCKLGMSPYATM